MSYKRFVKPFQNGLGVTLQKSLVKTRMIKTIFFPSLNAGDFLNERCAWINLKEKAA